MAKAAIEAPMTAVTARQWRPRREKLPLRRFEPNSKEMTFRNFIKIREMTPFSRGREPPGNLLDGLGKD